LDNERLKPEEKLNSEEKKFLEIIRDVGWGEINSIKIQNGKPVLVETKKTIKI